MNVDKIIKQATLKTADAVMDKLEERGFLERKKGNRERSEKSNRSAFQKTEILLYNYNNLKTVIKDKQAQIDFIRKNGLDITSKSITSAVSVQACFKCEAEEAEARIDVLEKSVALTKFYVRMLEDSLDSIKNDPYFDIIRLKYFEDLKAEDVADRLFVDVSTVNRNKRRLIDMLKIRLFSDEVIYELISSKSFD